MTDATAWARRPEQPEGHALDVLWSRRGVILLVAAAAAVVALVVSFLFPAIWESSAVVRIGQVGQSGSVGQTGTQLVEPVARVVGRIQTRRFQDLVLESVRASSGETDPDARLYRRSLSAKPIATTDLVVLQVRARSSEAARRVLQATVDQLARVHAEMAAPSIRSLREQAAQVEEQLNAAHAQVDEWKRLDEGKGAAPPGSRFEERVFLAGVISKRLEDIRTLAHQKSLLAEQLDPARTYPTSVVDPVRVDPKPVSPNPLRNSLLALFVGGLFGALVVLLIDAVRSSQGLSVPAPSANATPGEERPGRVRGEH